MRHLTLHRRSCCSRRIGTAMRICVGSSPLAADAGRKGSRSSRGKTSAVMLRDFWRSGAATPACSSESQTWNCTRSLGRCASRSAIDLYAMAARHRRDTEVAEEARLRARAVRYGLPIVAAVEVLYHIRAPITAGCDDVHSPRSDDAHRRPAAEAERRARAAQPPRFRVALCRRSRRGRAHDGNRLALQLLVEPAPGTAIPPNTCREA